MLEPVFDAPIPGSGLTKEVGASPLKNPPQYTTVDEAIEFYVKHMHGVEYDMGIDDEDDPERASNALVEVATEKLKRQQFENRNVRAAEEPTINEMPEDVSMPEEISGGLMSRGL